MIFAQNKILYFNFFPPPKDPNTLNVCNSGGSVTENQNLSIPKGQPADWTIEEVIQYITATDPALAIYADLFRTHVSQLKLSSASETNLIFSLFFVIGN